MRRAGAEPSRRRHLGRRLRYGQRKGRRPRAGRCVRCRSRQLAAASLWASPSTTATQHDAESCQHRGTTTAPRLMSVTPVWTSSTSAITVPPICAIPSASRRRFQRRSPTWPGALEHRIHIRIDEYGSTKKLHRTAASGPLQCGKALLISCSPVLVRIKHLQGLAPELGARGRQRVERPVTILARRDEASPAQTREMP